MLQKIDDTTRKANELKRKVWLMRYSEGREADMYLDEVMRLIETIKRDEIRYIVESEK